MGHFQVGRRTLRKRFASRNPTDSFRCAMAPAPAPEYRSLVPRS